MQIETHESPAVVSGESTKWLTVAEVSRIARVSPWLVGEALRTGRLRGAKIGGAAGKLWRIRLADVDRWIAGNV